MAEPVAGRGAPPRHPTQDSTPSQPAASLILSGGERVQEAHTVAERIYAHLRSLHTDRLGHMDTWPSDATQAGIAAAVGISRAHAALELRRLEGKGLVEVLKCHVAGASSRRRVYRVVDRTFTVVNGNGTPLPIAMGYVSTLRIVVVKCPSCGQRSKVALQE